MKLVIFDDTLVSELSTMYDMSQNEHNTVFEQVRSQRMINFPDPISLPDFGCICIFVSSPSFHKEDWENITTKYSIKKICFFSPSASETKSDIKLVELSGIHT